MSKYKWSHAPDDLGFVEKAIECIRMAKEDFGKVYLLDIGPEDAYWTAEYSSEADRTIAIDTWKGIYSHKLGEAKEVAGKRKDLQLIKQDAKEGLPVKNNSVHVVTNKDSTQSCKLVDDVYNALVSGGYYVKSGANNFWDSLGVILEIFEERPDYFGDEKEGKLPLTSSVRAKKKRLDPRSNFKEVDESELLIEEYIQIPDLKPEDVPPEMKIKISEEKLKMALGWNHILGENYDPDQHPEFMEKLNKGLERDSEGNYLVICYRCLLVAKKS